jgi:hypothetical protein
MFYNQFLGLVFEHGYIIIRVKFPSTSSPFAAKHLQLKLAFEKEKEEGEKNEKKEKLC